MQGCKIARLQGLFAPTKLLLCSDREFAPTKLPVYPD